MASLKHLDLLIGDALERLVDASDKVRNIRQIDNKQYRMKLGRIIAEIWILREELYGIDPDIKRDFVREHENDKERYEGLDKLHSKATEMEKSGDDPYAVKLYQELYEKSQFGYFRLLAEAGLYRVLTKKPIGTFHK